MGCAGEVMVGPKKVYLLDEPTTGLDSSTAHQVVRSIRDHAHLEQVPGSDHLCRQMTITLVLHLLR